METALENSVWVISPEFAGYLTKRGFHWRKLWKKRWVALHGSEIAYMAEEPNDNNTDDLVVTKAQITSATVVDREDIDGHPHGFAIHINDGQSPTWYLRAESTREKKSWLMRLGHVHTIVRWLEEFEKVRVLGVGGTGIVYELLHNANGQRYAMKEMEIKNKAQMQMAVAEAEMLKEIMENISHPNIMHIEKVFQVGAKFYLVFPLCTGGELYEHVIRRGHFTEFDAAKLMKDLISALHELHRHDILHLDIKPENIIFESDAEDARIKLTDFGLSKVFHNATKSSTGKNPTIEELNQKLKAFQDSGVLQRDRLRGTVGYMSPELILAGVSSRATDVWASGVVLYILLCGRPPFQSKSNRDILEKSARGDYSLEGKDWDGISAEAKDLVRRMLTVDPEKRITTGEILAHPWICMVNEDSFSCGTATPQREQLARRQSATNTSLNSALRALSSHVHEQKFEKMATNFTRLVSILQQNTGQKLVKYLNHPEDDGTDDPNDDTTMSPILSLEIRDALVNVFKELGGEDNGGKLTIEQFTQVLTHFGYGGKDGLAGGGGIMLICRFIDSDGDGLISPEDLFLAEARILQRSPQFLRAIFRVYTEAVWYPGRQLNHLSIQRATMKASQRQSGILGDNSNEGGDIVEPPKYITGRNVAAVFERLGYNPDAGTKLFGALCEALARKRAQNGRSVSTSAEREINNNEGIVPSPVTSPNPTPPRPVRNAALSAIVGGISDTVAALSISGVLSPKAAPVSTAGNNNNNNNSNVQPPLPPNQSGQIQDDNTQQTGFGQQNDGTNEATESKNYRMDVQDFIDACEIDDVLIEVIHLKPRSRMKKLMKKTSDSYDPSMSQASTNYTNEQLLAASENSTTSMGSPERAYTESDYIGEQIKVEFKKALANRRPST